MSKSAIYIWTILVVLFMLSPAQAGPYSDELGQCLVESTSTKDRNALVRWLFASASAHPAVSSIIWITPEQLDESNRETGALFNRILLESCREETKRALKYEGQTTMQASMEILGRVAGQELFGSPEVNQALTGLEQYLDDEDFESLLETSEP